MIGSAGDDAVVRGCENAAIRQAHAVRVVAEVLANVLGATEGALGVDIPRLLGEALGQAVEGLRILKFVEVTEGTVVVRGPSGPKRVCLLQQASARVAS